MIASIYNARTLSMFKLIFKLIFARGLFIIWGKEDKVYDISGVSKLQNWIASRPAIQLPKAGHLLLNENAMEVAAKYIRFLQTARGRYNK